MFNKDLKKRVRKVELVLGLRDGGWDVFEENSIDSITKRLSKIEDQLKPEPKFKKGDLVHFFLIDGEFDGEIVGSTIDRYRSSFFYVPSIEDSHSWVVSYLDENNVVQQVSVDEKDIWTDEYDCTDCLFSEIEDLKFRLKKLEDKKKK
jgi:hypothetical protein